MCRRCGQDEVVQDDPVYVDQLAAVQAFYAERGRDADLAEHVLGQWSGLLGCPRRDVITMLRIADIRRWCVVRGFDPPVSPDDYDDSDDLTLLATAIGQLQATEDVQPVLRLAGLAAIDRLEQVAGSDDDRRGRLQQLRSDLMTD
jgi:hypothetical protein